MVNKDEYNSDQSKSWSYVLTVYRLNYT